MTKIYTRTGDKGETGLFGGKRVRKDNARIAAYGDVDELNALVGWVRGLNDGAEGEIWAFLEKVQNDLFAVGMVLAAPEKTPRKVEGGVGPKEIAAIEGAIDLMDRDLPPLKEFILPGGSELSARLHMGRAVCRRAERNIVALAGQEGVPEEVMAYINRLSDFLFVLARWINVKQGISEKKWEKK